MQKFQFNLHKYIQYTPNMQTQTSYIFLQLKMSNNVAAPKF